MKNKKGNLDLYEINDLVNLFIEKEEKTIKEIKKQRSNISNVIKTVKKHLDNSGRVIYIGAGTSGRLGILDAVESKPTFSTSSFKAIIAGGNNAFIKSKEGAEDNIKQAIKDLKKIRISKKDVLIGVAASGETPYTLSAIKYANKIGVETISITSKTKSSLAKIAKQSINVDLGEELISGSSRLSSGTAQKIILNMVSSISMIKSGKVYGNLMIDVQPTNQKLIKRAVNIISKVCKISEKDALHLFRTSGKNTKIAVVMNKLKCSKATAKRILKNNKSDLRKVIN